MVLSLNTLMKGDSIAVIRIKESKGFLFDLALTDGIQLFGLVALLDALF